MSRVYSIKQLANPRPLPVALAMYADTTARDPFLSTREKLHRETLAERYLARMDAIQLGAFENAALAIANGLPAWSLPDDDAIVPLSACLPALKGKPILRVVAGGRS